MPSKNRTVLLTVDISNVLMCVTDLLSSVCENAQELLGLCLHSKSKVLRDVHSKCEDLLICLILRGSPLDVLYKVELKQWQYLINVFNCHNKKAFRNGIERHHMFESVGPGPSPWITLVLQNVFPEYPRKLLMLSDLSPSCVLILEVSVLLAQPQPNWALLFKV